MLNTLPERIALARRDGLDYADFLQIVLADEVSRRDHGRLELRLRISRDTVSSYVRANGVPGRQTGAAASSDGDGGTDKVAALLH